LFTVKHQHGLPTAATAASVEEFHTKKAKSAGAYVRAIYPTGAFRHFATHPEKTATSVSETSISPSATAAAISWCYGNSTAVL
jgi:hypothetical protein